MVPGLGVLARATAALALVIVLIRHGLSPAAGYDLFWHAATGEEMLRSDSLLPVDIFSYTAAGEPWPYKDAGAALLLAMVMRAGGLGGVVVLNAVILTLTVVALVLVMLRYRQVPFAACTVVTLVAIQAMAFRFHDRPQALAFAGAAAVLLVIERHRAGKGSLLWVVPLTALSANIHRGALLLPAVVMAHAACTAFEQRGRLSGPAVRDLALAVVGTALGCLATPFGVRIVSTSGLLLTDDASRSLLPEWYPTTLEHTLAASPATLAFLALALVSLVARGRRQQPWDLALLLLGAALAARAIRLLPYLAVLGAVPVAAGLGRAEGAWRGRVGHAIGIAASATGVLVALGTTPEPALGAEPERYPDRALSWVARHDVVGNPLNDFRFGGYLMYHAFPRYRVYVDGRNELVYSREHLRRAANVFRDPSLLAAEQRRTGFEWLILPTRPEDAALARIDRDPRWALVYVSQPAVVYVRATGPNAPLAAAHRYTALRAFDLERSIREAFRQRDQGDPKRASRVTAEVARLIRDDPDSYYAHAAQVLLQQLGAGVAR